MGGYLQCCTTTSVGTGVFVCAHSQMHDLWAEWGGWTPVKHMSVQERSEPIGRVYINDGRPQSGTFPATPHSLTASQAGAVDFDRDGV